jgi:signal transduction histidine kinase
MRFTRFNDLSLGKRVVLITAFSTSLSLFLVCSIIILEAQRKSRQSMESELGRLVVLLDQKIDRTWTRGDQENIQTLLNSLDDNPDILRACFYSPEGQILASYRWNPKDDRAPLETPSLRKDKGEYSDGTMRLFHDHLREGRKVGTIYVESDISDVKSLVHQFVATTLLTWAASFFFSFFIAALLQKRVVAPLGQMADQMDHIARGDADLGKRLRITGRDEVGRMAQAFNTFVGKLQSIEEMKLDLCAVASHQLKTPVIEINDFIENMLEGMTGELNPQQVRYLEQMRRIGKENFRLICDLLCVSKIERRVISTTLGPVSASEVVDAALRDHQGPMEEKGLELRRDIKKDVVFLADRDKMVEALRNLIDNAIKCTDQGSITIRIGEEGNEGFIEVEDTGIGMDPGSLGRLFTKGRVLGHEAHRSGAGLGLYICKHFMELQQGEVRVSSVLGKGSRFTLLVPRPTLVERETP